MAVEEKLQTSVKTDPAANRAEITVAVCAIVGGLLCALAGWMAWRPLGPLVLGIELLAFAWLLAREQRRLSSVSNRLRRVA